MRSQSSAIGSTARTTRSDHVACGPRNILWTAFCIAGLTTTAVVHAAALPLAQQPVGAGGREPAPNVIVSVDDSGSMGWDVNGCVTLDFKRDWYGSWFNQSSPAPSPACPTASLANATANLNKSRMFALKAALKAQFEDTSRTPDNRIRLAWQSMWGHTPSTPGSITNQLTLGATNSMKPLAGTHRSNFINWVNNLTPYNGTPSHKLASDAFNYMRSAAGTNSPWADTPGTAQATPYLACRRTYHILMTDGAWNNTSGTTAAGNADGTNRTLPDGIAYNTTSDQVRAYKDAYGGTTGNLSDHAFKAWATDLQDGTSSTQNMANSVKPLIRQAGTETVGATTLQEYWNPKNDPATWQHIVTHTIGFGKAATVWTGDPVWDNTTDDTYGGDYSALVNGTKLWQNQDTEGERSSELWHAALNGRGKFYPARDSSALSAAFTSILDNIIADTATALVSIAANSTTLQTSTNAYIAGFDSMGWWGSLKAYTIDSVTGARGATPLWYASGEDAAHVPQGVDASTVTAATRLILSHNGTSGISWEWASLSPAQQTTLNAGDSLGSDRLDYLRGERSKEVSKVPSGPFRNRISRLGDIVNSNVWYVGKPSGGYTENGYGTFRSANLGRTPMVYVGANDGMLHGFSAADGSEKIAYVPKGVLGNLVSYTSPSYTHKYYMDGQPFAGDAYLGGADGWKTLLVGGLGGGGKGYFVLDVTNPATGFTAGAAASLVKIDTTGGSDADIGHLYSPPVVDDSRPEKPSQIVKMNNGRWAVVMGNGYNSSNEKPVLLVQYLDGSRNLVKVAPLSCPAASCQGDGNGLSTPRMMDLNGDGKVDVAYAGDLKGNLWKFNLSSTSDSSWAVAFSGAPYFVAKNASDVPQPITTAPYALPSPFGGIMLAFGTGRNITDTDPATTGTDTMWGVWDDSVIIGGTTVTITDSVRSVINSSATAGRPSSLVAQTQTAVYTDSGGKKFYDVSRNAVTFLGPAGKRGWYMDWPLPGLRVLHNPMHFSGDRILVQSVIPTTGSGVSGETCTPTTVPETRFVSVFDIFSGNPSVNPVFTPVDATAVSGTSLGMAQINPGDNIMFRGDDKTKICSIDGCTDTKRYGGLGVRRNWREYQ